MKASGILALVLAAVVVSLPLGSIHSDEYPSKRVFPIRRLPGHEDRKRAAEAERQAAESGELAPLQEEAARAPTPRLPVFSNGFAGMDFGDSPESVPPDTHAAAGPNHIVEVVNSAIAIYDKTTGTPALGFPQSLESFFGATATSNCLFDPIVAYDELAERFVVGALDAPAVCAENPSLAPQTANLLYAVSDTDDPTGSFTEKHRIDVAEPDSNCPGTVTVGGDFTRFGWNAEVHVFTFNMFSLTTNCFDHVTVITIKKSTATDANNSTFTATHADLTNANFTVVPAVMRGSTPGGPMWLVEEAGFGNGNNLRIVKMTSVLNDPPSFTATDVQVAPYGSVPNATQSGGGFTLDAGDTRILNVEWRADRLVATQTVGLSGLARARWYEFDTSGGSPTFTQQSTIGPPGVHTYYPSIAIAENGDLGLTFMQSSSKHFLSMYVTGQSVGDPLGTTQTPVLARAGARNYKAFDCTSKDGCRAGDYSGITVDPSASDTFCAANEYATSATSENWGTWIQCFTLAPVHDLAVTAVKASKTAKNSVPSPVTVTIQNRSEHSETIASGDLGDGFNTGLVRLNLNPIDDDNESCGTPLVQLNSLKNAALFSAGNKILPVGKTISVNFLVTYNCSTAVAVKGDPSPNDYSLSASVHHEALAGTVGDTHPDDDSCPRASLGPDPNPPPAGILDKGCGAKTAFGTPGGPIVINVLP